MPSRCATRRGWRTRSWRRWAATHEGEPTLRAPAPGGLELVAWGPELVGQDRHLFATLADLTARAWEGQELAKQAARAETLAETDRIRAGLLAAVGHDLRTPLAGIKAATSSLRQDDVHWSDAERAELLQTIEESADRLSDVISNLLAMSRIQAGALPVSLQPVALDEVVARALLHGTTRPVAVDTPDSLPLVLADAGLLEQVIANLIDNAARFTPEGADRGDPRRRTQPAPATAATRWLASTSWTTGPASSPASGTPSSSRSNDSETRTPPAGSDLAWRSHEGSSTR